MADMTALQSRLSLSPQASAELSGLGTRELALSQQLKNAEIRMKNYEAALAKMSPSERDLNQMTLELRRQNVATLRADLDQTHVRMQELVGDKPEQVKVQTNPLTNPLIVGEGPTTVGTVEAPHFFGLEPRQFREPALFILLLPLILAASRWIWRRTPARPNRENAFEGNAQINRLEQAVEAIAIEVERISEAQRFSAKLMAERPKESAIEIIKQRKVATPIP